MWVFDAEFDGLNPTKIHVLSATQNGKKIFSTSDYGKMRKFLLNADILIGHNIQRFDIPFLEKILSIKIKAKLVDTLALSWVLYPSRNKHGLEGWGEEFGVPKPSITDWFNLTVEEYTHRCEEDVKINYRLWNNQWAKLNRLYSKEQNAWDYIDYLSFKMHCARLQEESGWKLDVEFTEASLVPLIEEQQQKTNALRKVMPKVAIMQKKLRPKKMHKADGSLTKLGSTWLTYLSNQNLPLDTEEIEIVTGYEDANPNSTDQKKDWLYSLGWKPATFKTVKNKKTGEKREVPQITKEAQKGGGICDSIKSMYDDHPDLELLEGLSILQHRIGILNGFLRDVDDKGYIKAQVKGLANTLRFQHTTIVNLPRAGRPYAEGIRGSLIAPPGRVLCGSDMSSLEDRLKQHFIFPLDPAYVASMQREDFDPHISLAVIAGMLSEDEGQFYRVFNILPEEEKDKRPEEKARAKKIKPTRDIAKNVNYALDGACKIV